MKKLLMSILCAFYERLSLYNVTICENIFNSSWVSDTDYNSSPGNKKSQRKLKYANSLGSSQIDRLHVTGIAALDMIVLYL